jgi:hypothetical protein
VQADKPIGRKAGRQTGTLAVKYVGRNAEKKGGLQAFKQSGN